MTNWEFLKAALDDQIDDGGASCEAEIFYHINCPYYWGDERSKCKDVDVDDLMDDDEKRRMCVECKTEWLEREYE